MLDCSVMHQRALAAFLAEQIAEAKEQGVLFSVHLKATMMKVSDPIIFGHAVRAYFAELFERHGDALAKLGVQPDDGLGALLKAVESLPAEERNARSSRASRPPTATGPSWPWSTPIAASPTSTSPPT